MILIGIFSFAANVFIIPTIDDILTPQTIQTNKNYYGLHAQVKVLLFIIGILRRCVSCRSRGELGSCKDPFTMNTTAIKMEKGVETIPCVSGWCGKIIERKSLDNGKCVDGHGYIFKFIQDCFVKDIFGL